MPQLFNGRLPTRYPHPHLQSIRQHFKREPVSVQTEPALKGMRRATLKANTGPMCQPSGVRKKPKPLPHNWTPAKSCWFFAAGATHQTHLGQLSLTKLGR